MSFRLSGSSSTTIISRRSLNFCLGAGSFLNAVQGLSAKLRIRRRSHEACVTRRRCSKSEGPWTRQCAILVDPPGNVLREKRVSRRLNDLLSAVCSIEEHFARSQNSETKKEDRKDQTDYVPAPGGTRRVLCEDSQNGDYR